VSNYQTLAPASLTGNRARANGFLQIIYRLLPVLHIDIFPASRLDTKIPQFKNHIYNAKAIRQSVIAYLVDPCQA